MAHILSETAGDVTTITLNRPEKMNALADSMREDLLAAITQAAGRVVAITGAGRAFCAGGDIDYMRKLRETGDESGMRRLLDAGRRVVVKIRSLPKPVVALVNGVAAGAGCNLALACDLRIASAEARFGQSFVKIGLHPDWGGSWMLPRLINPSRAAEMFFLGDPLDAGTAERYGLVNRVVPSDRLAEEGRRVCDRLARTPPRAIAAMKESIYGPTWKDFEAALDREMSVQLELFRTEDFAEGLAAFVEKRETHFRGV